MQALGMHASQGVNNGLFGKDVAQSAARTSPSANGRRRTDACTMGGAVTLPATAQYARPARGDGALTNLRRDATVSGNRLFSAYFAHLYCEEVTRNRPGESHVTPNTAGPMRE